jgi:hypothetical protein
MQSKQLLAESQILEDEILSEAEDANHPANEVPEQQDHGQDLIATPGCTLFGSRLFYERRRF